MPSTIKLPRWCAWLSPGNAKAHGTARDAAGCQERDNRTGAWGRDHSNASRSRLALNGEGRGSAELRYHTASLKACMAAAKAHELHVMQQLQNAEHASSCDVTATCESCVDIQAYGARAFTKTLAECLQARGVLQHFTPPP